MDMSQFEKEEPELPSSDESDQDYVPSGADSNLSEEDSDGEAEDPGSDGDAGPSNRNKKGKIKKSSTKKRKRQNRKTPLLKQNEADKDKSEEENVEPEEKKKLTEEEVKKKADSIWQEFLKDTGTPTRPSAALTNGNAGPSKSEIAPSENKVKITKVFEFAGEEVRVEKEVAADSAEARLSSSSKCASPATPARRGPPPAARGGLKGLSSVLGQIGKKPKLGTLEKSKLDWERFKKDQGIEEELQTHNKGKDGYLERQDFLQRADIRQFEIERDMRANRRSNR